MSNFQIDAPAHLVRYDAADPDKMKLPSGVTCGDCIHIYRCKTMFGHVETDTRCDWSPSRYWPAPEVERSTPMTDTAPSPLPEPLPKPLICGHCLMEITHQSGLRYFGTSVAHQEYECLRLLRAEIERLTAALAAAEADARQLREALRTLVKSNPDPFHYLDRGIGTKSKDGQAWLAARDAIDATQKEKP